MFHLVPSGQCTLWNILPKYVASDSKYGDIVIRRIVTEKDIKKEQQLWTIVVASIN